jgi:single-strand DNA-binding protein
VQLNRIVLIGRLTNDPEASFTNNEMELSKFRLAVNRPGANGRDNDGRGQTADFFNVVCFRKTAEFVNKYLHRGNLVCVEGHLHIDDYEDKDNNKRQWIQVQADGVQNLTPRADADAAGRDRDFAEDDKPTPSRGRREDARTEPRDDRDSARRGDRDKDAPDEPRGDRATGDRATRRNAPDDDEPRGDREPRGGRERGARDDNERGGRAPARGSRGGNYDQDDDDPFAEQ